jgi:hypothetical protein
MFASSSKFESMAPPFIESAYLFLIIEARMSDCPMTTEIWRLSSMYASGRPGNDDDYLKGYLWMDCLNIWAK